MALADATDTLSSPIPRSPDAKERNTPMDSQNDTSQTATVTKRTILAGVGGGAAVAVLLGAFMAGQLVGHDGASPRPSAAASTFASTAPIPPAFSMPEMPSEAAPQPPARPADQQGHKPRKQGQLQPPS